MKVDSRFAIDMAEASKKLVSAMNCFSLSLEETNRCISILSKNRIFKKTHPFAKFM